MTETVRVRVTTVSGEETLSFIGSGTLVRDDRGMHLRYSARSEEGESVTAAVHLAAGRALLVSGNARLLLDPAQPTAARIESGAGMPPLTVTTHRITHEKKDGSETIRLHYTLSAAAQIVAQIRLRVDFEPMRSETL